MDLCSINLVSFKYLNQEKKNKKRSSSLTKQRAAFKLCSFILLQAAAPRGKELSLIALAQQGCCIYSVAALKVFPR